MKTGLSGNSERAAICSGAELTRPESAVAPSQARAVFAWRPPRRATQRAGSAYNNRVNATVRPVTPLACASGASRPPRALRRR